MTGLDRTGRDATPRKKHINGKKNAAVEFESPSEHPSRTLDSQMICVSLNPSLRYM